MSDIYLPFLPLAGRVFVFQSLHLVFPVPGPGAVITPAVTLGPLAHFQNTAGGDHTAASISVSMAFASFLSSFLNFPLLDSVYF